jgi:outer membrane receptor protein involved in Fe transport
MKLHLLFASCLAFFSATIVAQPFGGASRGGGMANMQSGRFYGKVLDAKTNRPIEAASIQLISAKFDRVKMQRKDTTIGGMLTPGNGNFALENVPFMGDYTLKITAIGYKPYSQKQSFLSPEMQQKMMQAFAQMGAAAAPKKDSAGKTAPAAPAPNMQKMFQDMFGGDMSKMMAMADKDLGNIKLEQDANQLDNVTVTASKSMTLAVDRRIFNIDKNLSASGGTATDIMRQLPSINVDIDGNVTVRNASPTLFVDGRPTTLTLDQIPADAIQSVELITNPSAKFDASGGGAAILNVVMKKNRKSGYNGSLRAGIDSRFRPNVGGDFSIRQGKLNVFGSGQFGARKSISTSDINTTYYASGNKPATAITQDIYNVSKGYFAFLRGGVDYFIDNRNTITVSGNYVRGRFKNDETNNQRYDSFYTPVRTETGYRKTESDGYFQNVGATLSYKHLFAKPGHELTADVNLNTNKSDNDAEFSSQRYNMDNSPKGKEVIQQTDGGSKSTFVVMQADYANPITDKLKLEAGLRGQIRDFSSKNLNAFYDYNTGEFVQVANISSNYEFTDQVYAAYATVTGKAGKLGYNVGLRLESSNYKGLLVEADSSFSVQFPISAFPSAFLSYKLNDKSDLQMNYSRRINRPSFFQLMPFIDYTDPLNLRQGNPALTPEFTNSIEVNYSYIFNSSHNLLFSSYFKHTTDLITNYQYKGQNPATKDSAIFNTYINANSSQRYGLELTSRNAFTKKFDVTTNLNFYNAKINSENIEQNLSNSQFSFFGKMTATQKIGKNNQWTIQANGDYQSKTVLPAGGGGRGFGGMNFGGGIQAAGSNGFVNPNYGMDLSIRRDIIKNKTGQGYQGSITISMNDLFRSRIYDVSTSSDFFEQTLRRRRDPRIVRLQFNWRFGKVDTNLFRRKNLKGEMEGMSEGMSGAGN